MAKVTGEVMFRHAPLCEKRRPIQELMLPGNTNKFKAVSDTSDDSDACCKTKALISVSHKLARRIISWKESISLQPWLSCASLKFWVFYIWKYFLSLNDYCIPTKVLLRVEKSELNCLSSPLSLFLVLTLQLNVRSVNGYHLPRATKEESGCCCGSVFARNKEKLGTREAELWG